MQTKIEEKKKKVRRPEILNHAHVNVVYAEIETLQSVVGEIYDTERKREFIKQQEKDKKIESSLKIR